MTSSIRGGHLQALAAAAAGLLLQGFQIFDDRAPVRVRPNPRPDVVPAVARPFACRVEPVAIGAEPAEQFRLAQRTVRRVDVQEPVRHAPDRAAGPPSRRRSSAAPRPAPADDAASARCRCADTGSWPRRRSAASRHSRGSSSSAPSAASGLPLNAAMNPSRHDIEPGADPCRRPCERRASRTLPCPSYSPWQRAQPISCE